MKNNYTRQNLHINCQILVSSLLGSGEGFLFSEVWRQMLPESSVEAGEEFVPPHESPSIWMHSDDKPRGSLLHAKIREGPTLIPFR